MIDPDLRKAVYHSHLSGMPTRTISTVFHISRNAVRAIIKQRGVAPNTPRRDRIVIDPDLLRRLYGECNGWISRIHEILVEEHGAKLSYSTLTRLIRSLGLGRPAESRCDRVPDEPGLEMQHDTTTYKVKFSGQRTEVIASLIYLRYSKRKYLKFYRVFNRFAMKCFLHEALMFWGYSARQCIIDNTSLARLRGTGRKAVIAPEMDSFSQRYGFEFQCHELRHANRKAGNERSFWSVETSFLAGRTYAHLEDMNRQALEWATVRMHHRPVGKSKLIPAKAFEHERSYLQELSPHLPAPYQEHQRGTDQYGYAAFNGNYYWVPGTKRKGVKLLQYADCLKIFQHRECVAQYRLPPDGVKDARFSPEGQPPPRHMPKNRKHGSRQEEKRLRAMGPDVEAYVDYAINLAGIQRHRFLRELWKLSRQVTSAAFVHALKRALQYRVAHIESLHKIAWFCMAYSQESPPMAEVDVDENYRHRPAYQEGCLTDEPDLSIYDDNNDHNDQESEEPDGDGS